MEVIDIGLSDLEPISLNMDDLPNTSSSSSGGGPSVNFGPGIELLMNDKKKSSSSSMNIDLGELDKLENELNELSGMASEPSTPRPSSSGETKTLSGFASNLFGFGNSNKKTTEPAKTAENDSKLGHATAGGVGNTKTWDGYSKLNEVPLTGSNATAQMTDREKRRKKRAMIKKLDEWYEKGLTKHSSRFNMDSAYEEVEDEYETALEDKRKKDSVKLQGWWFMTFINSLEYANTVFNPFDLNLDGWGEQVSEDIDSYEEIFSELHEKYKGGKMSPEISLLLRLGFSAAVVNITNKALSTATPGFNDVIKQSPELMKMFTNATVQSMSQASPGFSMASNLVNGAGPQNSDRPNTMFGAPPAPVETKNQPPPTRPGMQYTQNPQQSNRPDISAGRGTMFRESGIELNQSQDTYSNQPTSRLQRPEMRGPQNPEINSILSGLKTREVNTSAVPVQQQPQNDDNNDSMISISSLKDLQNTNMPKRSNRRKQKSDRNIVSLDI
jgi:hypothetical protein